MQIETVSRVVLDNKKKLRLIHTPPNAWPGYFMSESAAKELLKINEAPLPKRGQKQKIKFAGRTYFMERLNNNRSLHPWYMQAQKSF
jgi:hypothetical protein